MKLENAIKTKEKAKQAIAILETIVIDLRDSCSEDEFKLFRRAVGNSMAVIINQILEPTYFQYPEIDDDR
jgi:hypothetical protein